MRSLAWLVVLVDHRHPVALADAVVDAGHRDFELAEFAALCAVVLGAGVEAVDLLVRGVGDQRDLARSGGLGERRPVLRRRARRPRSRVSAMCSCPRAW